jgi:hypothetical protein
MERSSGLCLTIQKKPRAISSSLIIPRKNLKFLIGFTLRHLISLVLPTASLQHAWYTSPSLFLAITLLRLGLSKFLRPADTVTRLVSLLAVFCHVVAVLVCIARVHQFSSIDWQEAPLEFGEKNVYYITNVLVLLSLFLLSSSSHLFSGRILGPLAALCVTFIGFFLFHNFSNLSGYFTGEATAMPWAFSSTAHCTFHEKPWWASLAW